MAKPGLLAEMPCLATNLSTAADKAASGATGSGGAAMRKTSVLKRNEASSDAELAQFIFHLRPDLSNETS
jgi:hypothetical protein